MLVPPEVAYPPPDERVLGTSRSKFGCCDALLGMPPRQHLASESASTSPRSPASSPDELTRIDPALADPLVPPESAAIPGEIEGAPLCAETPLSNSAGQSHEEVPVTLL